MKDGRVLMLLIFSTFLLRELWTLFPKSDALIKPFLFSEQQIGYQTYVWMMCGYAIQIIIYWALIQIVTDKTHIFFNVVFALAVLEIFEFIFNYNQYWFNISGIGVNITTLRYVILSSIILFKIVTWKT